MLVLLISFSPLLAAVVLAQPVSRAEGACPSADGWTYLSAPHRPVRPVDEEVFSPTSVAVSWKESPAIFVSGYWGLVRSDDCGLTWSSIASADDPGGPYLTVAIDQTGRLYLLSYEQMGISDDGGLSWQRPRVFYPGDTEGSVPYGVALGIAPTVPGMAYAWIKTRAGRGEQVTARSIDGGLTWQVVARRPFGSPIVIDPDPAIVYSAFSDRYISRNVVSDANTTYERLAEFREKVSAVAMSADGTRLWAATVGNVLYLSRDRGATWSEVPGSPPAGSWRYLAVPPLEPHILYGISQDGGLWIYREPADTAAEAAAGSP
ncbi:MAG: exo-alpha-sialidase [Chloroflexi bacterium]|nr:exo-alpha-sialidase [Chloroflexota bacterium]